jgi:uncharacterized membrane protein YuzA (DUF378 family)
MVVVLVVVGALNWGFVGLCRYDLVAALLGDATVLGRLVYIVMGVAGLFLALQWKGPLTTAGWATGGRRPT